jgi:probable F420-dependent oxidoreductase
VLAKEMATLDVLSEGRLIVGLGAGWVRDEYDGLGVTMERPSVRIAKLAEYVDVMRAHWSGVELDVHGSFVDVSGFSGLPSPVQPSGPPIMIGGGAPKILGLAGRVADIVSLNFNNASGRLGSSSVMSSGPAETDEKISWIRNGAGDRFDQIEIEIGAYFVGVGDGSGAQLDAMAARFGVAVDEFAAHPHAFFGSVEQICELLIDRRERFGVSYVTVAQRHLDEFGPVVAAMAGR